MERHDGRATQVSQASASRASASDAEHPASTHGADGDAGASPTESVGNGAPAAPLGDQLTVDQLAARAGVTVRTVRFYSTRGLLPPPTIGPRRIGRYGPDHLARLALIEELQHQGMTLAAIERYIQRLPEDITAHELAIHRAIVSSWLPDTVDEASRAQLEGRVGRELTDEDLGRLTAMRVLERTEDPDVFLIDPATVHLGVRLLDVPISTEAIVSAHDVMLEHSRAAARELSRLFKDEVWEPYRERRPDEQGLEEMKYLSAHMQPMVVQALVTAFQRSMQEELRSAFPHERAPRTGGEGGSGDGSAMRDDSGS